MRAAVWVVVVVAAACSSEKGPPRPNAVCPDIVRDHVWRRELFPGCPPPPFETVGVVCDGACPRPCHVFIDREGGARSERYEYDADGRWARTVSEPDIEFEGEETRPEPRPGSGPRYCGGTGRHRDCELRSSLNRLDDDHEVAEYTLDAAGNVVEVEPRNYPPAQFAYEGRRLVAERALGYVHEYHYDARGRIGVIETRGSDDRFTYTYDDATHRLASIKQTRGGLGVGLTTFEYDDRGRPAKIAWRLDGDFETRRYVYECPSLPYADALAAMHAFRVRACACTDAGCLMEAHDDLQAWARGTADATHYAAPTDRERIAYLDDARAALDCIFRGGD